MKKTNLFFNYLIIIFLLTSLTSAQGIVADNPYCNDNTDCPAEKPYCISGSCKSDTQVPNQPLPCKTNDDCPFGQECYAENCKVSVENNKVIAQNEVNPTEQPSPENNSLKNAIIIVLTIIIGFIFLWWILRNRKG